MSKCKLTKSRNNRRIDVNGMINLCVRFARLLDILLKIILVRDSQKAAATNINFIPIMAAPSCFLSLPFAPTLDHRTQPPSLRHSRVLFQFGFSPTLRPSQSSPLSPFFPFVLLSLFCPSPFHLASLYATISLFFSPSLPGLSIPGQISRLAR